MCYSMLYMCVFGIFAVQRARSIEYSYVDLNELCCLLVFSFLFYFIFYLAAARGHQVSRA